MKRYDFYPYPDPKDKIPLYINDPEIIDNTVNNEGLTYKDTEETDNIRIYVPLDLNKSSILRRLDAVISHYREANEGNESDFSIEVRALIEQICLYDRIWYVRHMPERESHSKEAKELVEAFIRKLEAIPDGCAERFPFDIIEELRKEYAVGVQ